MWGVDEGGIDRYSSRCYVISRTLGLRCSPSSVGQGHRHLTGDGESNNLACVGHRKTTAAAHVRLVEGSGASPTR